MDVDQFEKSAIWADVRKVIFDKSKPIKHNYNGVIHTVKEDLKVYKILSIDTEQDFVNRTTDFIKIRFMMAFGDYVERLYPHRNNLEFTTKIATEQETANVVDAKAKLAVTRYKAIFVAKENPQVNASEVQRMDKESLNKMHFVEVTLELYNRSYEALRIKFTRGSFHNETCGNLMHGLMAGESSRIKIDGKPSVDGIDIVKPDNVEKQPHINLPDGTPLVNLPTYLQHKSNGVYSSGIGNYFTNYRNKKIWFVYPLWDMLRFDEDVPKVSFYSVPSNRYPNLDRTYKEDGDMLHVAITSEHKYQDAADVDYMNHGVGFRLTDARAMMSKPVEMTKEGPKGRRVNLNTEVASHSRDDGLNFAPTSSRGISSNPYVDYSAVNARRVARVDLVWDNSNPALIYPGMPCQFLFMDGRKLVKLKGIILYQYALTALQGSKVQDNTFRTKSQITIALERYNSEQAVSKFNAVGNIKK